MIEQLISLIAPHYCIHCNAEGAILCASCVTQLDDVPPRCYRCARLSDGFRTCSSCRSRSSLFAVWAVTPYRDVAKEVVHRLKFERARAASTDIAARMAGVLPQNIEWLVTHAPTATSRVRSRGYDQAQLIAKQVAKQLGCRYAPLLARVGQERQVGQKRGARKEQMDQAFVCTQGAQVRRQHILLIDDVLTTGATLEAAGKVLKAAGAARVSAAVFAVA